MIQNNLLKAKIMFILECFIFKQSQRKREKFKDRKKIEIKEEC